MHRQTRMQESRDNSISIKAALRSSSSGFWGKRLSWNMQLGLQAKWGGTLTPFYLGRSFKITLQRQSRKFEPLLPMTMIEDFPCNSAGKESTCNAGDPGLIPGLGRSPEDGIGYPLRYSWAYPIAQLVKIPSAMCDTWVWSLCWEYPLEKERATHSRVLQYSGLENSVDCIVHGVPKSQTWLSCFHFHFTVHVSLSRVTIYSLDPFPNFESVHCSMSNRCFLTCVQVFQESGKAIRYHHLFKNFLQFFVIHTKALVNKAEVDVFLESPCFFYDPMDVGNLISCSSVSSKSSLYIWKFSFHIMLKLSLKDFEHYLARMWDEQNFEAIWTSFSIAFLGDWNKNWKLYWKNLVLLPLLSFPNLQA